MIIKIERKKVDLAIRNGISIKQLTKNIYIARKYGNKKLHPIGYYIPVIIIVID